MGITIEAIAAKLRTIPERLDWLLSPRSERILTRFLKKETQNPYVANALLVAARSELGDGSGSNGSIEAAIEMVRNDATDGLVSFMNGHVHTSKVSGGGGLRGLFYCPEQEILPIEAESYYGTSIGAVDSTFHARRKFVRKDGSHAQSPDVSKKSFTEAANRLANALNDNGWLDHFRYVRDVRKLYRGVLGEAFFYQGPITQILVGLFGTMMVKEFYKLRIMVSDFLSSERIMIASDNEHKDMLVSCALEETTAFPLAFSPIRKAGHVTVDGGLHVTPIRLAADEGADFIWVTLLNLYVPKLQDIDGSGPLGKIRLAYRMYEILQRDASREAIIQTTRKTPEYVRKFGDPHGMLILSAEDLSEFDPFTLTEKHQKLFDIGRAATNVNMDKLSPNYRHPGYDPHYFIERLRLQRKFGDKLKLSTKC
ncbi:hypothetical protein HYY71_07435 [Candidatus Woesearchaeota archaeon]|nr:hypothetical protein [Candidatus Woesearchaeota archaeon]